MTDNPVRDNAIRLRLSSPTPRSFRAARVQGLFDIPTTREQVVEIAVDAPIDAAPWQIGAIVGPSGSGKSSVARALFPAEYAQRLPWEGGCVVDGFPAACDNQEIFDALIAVGLSSTPVWLRPYAVLSTGQQFRADLARALVAVERVVFDEFTSVVDRAVAAAASTAVSKWVRRTGRQFVAVTCHDDVIDWLQPDWVIDMTDQSFSRRSLQRRPAIPLAIHEGSRAAWPVFVGHHYLSHDLHRSARVFLAYATLYGEERLVGFYSLITALGHRGAMRGWLRGHRTVVLPDYQGLGIGNRFIEAVNEWLWQHERVRVRARTSAPALIAHRRKHPEMWRCVAKPAMNLPQRGLHAAASAGRLGTTWEYIPEALRA